MALKSDVLLDNWYKNHGGNPNHRYSPSKRRTEYNQLIENIGDVIHNIEGRIGDLETDLYQLSDMVEELKKSHTAPGEGE